MKIHVYIDGDNVYFLQRDLLTWRVDFKKLLDYFRTFGEVISANFYTSSAKPDQTTRQAFFRSLGYLGYSVTTKNAKESMRDGKTVHKVNLDTVMVRDMTLNIDQYDMAILVTGDADFICMIETFTSIGKPFKLVSTEGCVANEMREKAGMNYIDIAPLKDILEMDE
jgi:uncharacterized LabA/DUF88 family protein